MWFKRMPLEDWFDTYQYEVEYDVGESAIKYHNFDELNINLGSLPLRYGHHKGRPDLRDTISKSYEGFTGNEIIVTTGASEANFIIVSALVKPGDNVIIEHPNYPSLYEVPRSLGCDVTLFSLEYSNNFKPDLDKLKSLLKPNTKLISLTHPNNPTGSMISADELEKYVEFAEENNAYLMLDETYRELAFETRLPGAASLSPKVISISSMSKCYGLPGIRTGWLASSSKEFLDMALAIREQISITNGAINEEIAFQTLNRKDEFLNFAKKHIKKNFDLVTDWIGQQDTLEWIKPEKGVVSLPRIKKGSCSDPEDVYKLLAEKYKTFVVPGRCFEMDNHHFRFGFGGSYEEIEKGLHNINSALGDILL